MESDLTAATELECSGFQGGITILPFTTENDPLF